jgi:hypothetical protein
MTLIDAAGRTFDFRSSKTPELLSIHWMTETVARRAPSSGQPIAASATLSSRRAFAKVGGYEFAVAVPASETSVGHLITNEVLYQLSYCGISMG